MYRYMYVYTCTLSTQGYFFQQYTCRWYQGCIKRRGHVTPDTLPIDIEILDITKK